MYIVITSALISSKNKNEEKLTILSFKDSVWYHKRFQVCIPESTQQLQTLCSALIKGQELSIHHQTWNSPQQLGAQLLQQLKDQYQVEYISSMYESEIQTKIVECSTYLIILYTFQGYATWKIWFFRVMLVLVDTYQLGHRLPRLMPNVNCVSQRRLVSMKYSSSRLFTTSFDNISSDFYYYRLFCIS